VNPTVTLPEPATPVTPAATNPPAVSPTSLNPTVTLPGAVSSMAGMPSGYKHFKSI
jgi:hypothetical protein